MSQQQLTKIEYVSTSIDKLKAFIWLTNTYGAPTEQFVDLFIQTLFIKSTDGSYVTNMWENTGIRDVTPSPQLDKLFANLFDEYTNYTGGASFYIDLSANLITLTTEDALRFYIKNYKYDVNSKPVILTEDKNIRLGDEEEEMGPLYFANTPDLIKVDDNGNKYIDVKFISKGIRLDGKLYEDNSVYLTTNNTRYRTLNQAMSIIDDVNRNAWKFWKNNYEQFVNIYRKEQVEPTVKKYKLNFNKTQSLIRKDAKGTYIEIHASAKSLSTNSYNEMHGKLYSDNSIVIYAEGTTLCNVKGSAADAQRLRNKYIDMIEGDTLIKDMEFKSPAMARAFWFGSYDGKWASFLNTNGDKIEIYLEEKITDDNPLDIFDLPNFKLDSQLLAEYNKEVSDDAKFIASDTDNKIEIYFRDKDGNKIEVLELDTSNRKVTVIKSDIAEFNDLVFDSLAAFTLKYVKSYCNITILNDKASIAFENIMRGYMSDFGDMEVLYNNFGGTN